MASGECFTGVVKKENGRFGFIQQDNGGDDMFVMPGECIGFGRALPPVGTRVMYTVGRDPQKGEPRAEDVVPEDEGVEVMEEVLGLFDPEQAEGEPQLPEGTLSGTVKGNNGSFGFILQDNGEADMFLMPVQCQAFGGRLPPVGTRVVYTVTTDEKTGRPRADDVQPEEALLGNPAPPRQLRELRPHQTFDGMQAPPADDLQSMLEAGTCTGMVKQNSGRFGFISQDGSETDMFFMPVQCQAFGGVCPPVGTRVMYEVTEDAKTRRPRAENVRPEEPGTPSPASAGSARAALLCGETERGSYRGAVKLNNGNFGFILQDSGEADMFVMPAQCADFGGRLPPVGTRVTYDVGRDPKTEKPRAENVQPEEEEVAGSPSMRRPRVQIISMPALPFSAPSAPSGDEYSGAIKQNNGRFGFIVTDDGQADMFVMPLQCTGFNGECPPVGTRVIYKVGIDPKSGRPRAEDVRPEGGSGGNGCGGKYGPVPRGCGKGKGFGSHPYGRAMDFW